MLCAVCNLCFTLACTLLYHALHTHSKRGFTSAEHSNCLSFVPKNALFLYRKYNLALTFFIIEFRIDDIL